MEHAQNLTLNHRFIRLKIITNINNKSCRDQTDNIRSVTAQVAGLEGHNPRFQLDMCTLTSLHVQLDICTLTSLHSRPQEEPLAVRAASEWPAADAVALAPHSGRAKASLKDSQSNDLIMDATLATGSSLSSSIRNGEGSTKRGCWLFPLPTTRPSACWPKDDRDSPPPPSAPISPVSPAARNSIMNEEDLQSDRSISDMVLGAMMLTLSRRFMRSPAARSRMSTVAAASSSCSGLGGPQADGRRRYSVISICRNVSSRVNIFRAITFVLAACEWHHDRA